ncbi:MAG TPA: KH domain-containing protein [Vicinamibacteria bacterium]|nr:KH domain-containing protein [Vicinamibacteria bacterium]
MKELLEALARALVDEPRRVRVRERVDEDFVRLELEVAPEDRGRVIGRGGRTVDALRTLLDAVARSQDRECRLEVMD